MRATLYTLMLLFLVFLNFSISFAMSDQANKRVMFQGQQYYIMHLLIKGCRHKSHPFSATPVIRKIDNAFCYKSQDDVHNLTADDFIDIHKGNYIYIDNCTVHTTRLSQGQIVPVSLFIVGSNDENDLELFERSYDPSRIILVDNKSIKIPLL